LHPIKGPQARFIYENHSNRLFLIASNLRLFYPKDRDEGEIMKNIKPLASLLLMTFVMSLSASAAFTADTCQKSCSIDADCGQGGFCNSGSCQHQPTYCSNERWSVNERGEIWNCNAYRCNDNNGLCFRSSVSNDNCTSGYVFDGKSSCIPSVSCAAGDPSCQDLYARWVKARHDFEAQTPAPQPTLFSCLPCHQHSDCGTEQMCWQNHCEKSDLYCAIAGNGDSLLMSKQGIVANCNNFSCDPIAKACFNQCQASQDCRTGKSCVSGLCL